MFDWLFTRWLTWLGGTPCFQVYGRARPEIAWRTIDVFATHRRNLASRWPLWRGTCVTWTSSVIVVGWDFAEELVREQITEPASRERPVEVAGGRLRHLERRVAAGALPFASASEIMAHECGHTRQVLRLGSLYLPVVGAVTWLREGPHFWNHFENQASATGQFGGLINGSVCETLWQRIHTQ